MDPLNIEGLPANALVLVDTAPIIYVLEGHPQLARRFRPLFEAHEAGALQLAITTVTITEVMTGPEQAKVMTGPAQARDDDLALRYSEIALQYSEVFSSWRVVALDYDIACRAAVLRAMYRLKLPDAVQAASAFAIDADALVTHDRDFSRLKSRLTLMRIIC
jgi:predicted nucleic acid-binding protein